MLKRLLGMAGTRLCLLVAGPSPEQSPSLEQMAAARELIVTIEVGRST
jgi:hypothetical protein